MMPHRQKLPKSMSLSCVRTPELKDQVLDDVKQDQDETMPHYFKAMTSFTMMLIDFTQFPEHFANFIEENIIDVPMKRDLEDGKIINWCRTVKPLFPIKTRGDGNCLLHAVTLAMWGIHDSSAYLRRLVFVALVSDGSPNGGRIRQRWQRTRAQFNEDIIHGGIHFNSKDWDTEWQQVIFAANDVKKRSDPNQPMYDFLEDIHIFVLSNILRRPIIILADSIVRSPNGSNIGENNFSGIYLPLLWPPEVCVKCPIILAFANSHFCPLIGMEDGLIKESRLQPENAVPLVTKNLENLVLHYLMEDEERRGYDLLKLYLEVVDINWTRSDSVQFFPCAKLKYNKLSQFDVLKDHILELEIIFREQLEHNLTENGNDKELHSDLDETNMDESEENGLSDEEMYNFCSTEQKDKEFTTKDISFENYNEDKPLNDNNFNLSLNYDKKTNQQDESYHNSALEHQCKYNMCFNFATAKTYPFCHVHRRKRSNSFDDIEHMNTEVQKIGNLDDKQAGNSLTGQHGNFNDTSRPCLATGCSLYGLKEWDYMCSGHRNPKQLSDRQKSITLGDKSYSCDWQKCRTPKKKCVKNGHAHYGGQCTNCYVAEGKKQDEEALLCKNSDCSMFGHVEYNNYCSKCVLKFGFQSINPSLHNAQQVKIPIEERKNMEKMDILGLLTDRPLSELKNAREFFECQFHNCKQLSTESSLGYCAEHFVIMFKLGRLDIPSEEEVVRVKKELKRKAEKARPISLKTGKKATMPVENTNLNESQLYKKQHQQYNCVTDYCHGIRCKNEYGLCLSCFDAKRNGKKHENGQKLNNGERDIVESTGGESLSYSMPPRCRGPVCNNRAFPLYNGLCEACYNTLSVVQAEKMQEIPISPTLVPTRVDVTLPMKVNIVAPSQPKQLSKKCKTDNCSMHGTKAQMGYCSKCFTEATLASGKSKHAKEVSSQEELRLIRLNMMTEAEVMRELPLDRVTNYPRKCITEMCDLYGDPVYRGFCSKCAETRGMFSRRSQPEPVENNTHCQVPIQHSFEEPMEVQQPQVVVEQGASGSKSDLDQSDPTGYLKAIKQLENQSRSQKCKTPNCENYGSSKNQGYCTNCVTLYGKKP